MCYLGIHGTAWRSIGLLVHSDGRIASVESGGPIHPHELCHNDNYTSIQSLLHKLITNSEYAQLNTSNCNCICLALPGIRSSLDVSEMQGILSAGGWTGINQIIVSDASVTLLAGGLTEYGISIICGSGSKIYGKDLNKTEWQVGGWGSTIGEEGSGYKIAKAALRAIAHSEEGTGEKCPNLTKRVMSALCIDSIDALIRWANLLCNMGSLIKISGIVPAIIAAAEEDNDQTALSILDNSCAKLSEGFRIVRSKMNMDEIEYPVILEGGVIEHSQYLRNILIRQITEIDPKAQVSLCQYRAVVGAALMAISGGNELPPNKIITMVKKSINKLPKHPIAKLLKGPEINIAQQKKEGNLHR